jgi:hypothetical protein
METAFIDAPSGSTYRRILHETQIKEATCAFIAATQNHHQLEPIINSLP